MCAEIAPHYGFKRVSGKVVFEAVAIKHLDLDSVLSEPCQEGAHVGPLDKAISRVVVRPVAV